MTILPFPVVRNVFTPEAYGADPTGAKDSTAALQAAINAAQAVSGAVELAAGATYKHSAALALDARSIEVFGHGQGSVLLATAAMAGQIAATDTAFSTFRDFVLDGGGFACDGLHFVTSNAPADKATSNKWVRVTTLNHPDGNWGFYNQGHEDLTAHGCIGREAVNGVHVSIPGGAMRFSDCSIFGFWELDYQLIGIDNCVTGPFSLTPNTGCLLAVSKSYCYDSATRNLIVGNGGNPPSVSFKGCYLALVQAIFNTGFGPPTVMSFEDCTVAYTGPAAPYNIIDVGGNGKTVLRNIQYGPGAATASQVASVAGGATPYIVVDPAIQGATAPGNYLANPAVPASGTAYTNASPGPVIYTTTGGTVSAISADGVASGLTAGPVLVLPGHTITWTYTALPAVTARQGE